jgi:membrane protease YdiL (CAAX protease family)
MATRSLLRNHPLLSYYVITFVISWGGFSLVAGSGGLSSTDWQSAPAFPFMVGAMLAGPTVAGLMTGLTAGRAGLHELGSRLLKWRVGIGWYAVALLPAPILSLIALFALGLTSPLFMAEDKTLVLVPGIVAGLTVIFEEIGWTGFAVPRFRLRRSVFTTGLIVGVLWGVWHLLQQVFISGSYAAGIPMPLYMAVAIFNTVAGLTAYRVLLVWVYDRTGSLLVTTLMHSSLTACNIFIFRPEATGVPFIAFGLLFTALQWLAVAAVAVADRGRLTRRPV